MIYKALKDLALVSSLIYFLPLFSFPAELQSSFIFQIDLLFPASDLFLPLLGT